jgi:threonylcarbamoyladenosine tRNA methylthiotransferase MtaB
MASAVLIKSIGCRTNQEEMAALGTLLAQNGHTVVDSLARADVVVVNTCLVTSTAEAKTRRYISALSRARPGVKICVTGCLAQYSPHDIMQRLPVTWVVGNGRKHDIPAILRDKAGGVFHGELDPLRSAAVSLVNTPAGPGVSGRTRFFLKIQEGCNFRCAYCVVPLVRGPSASVPFDHITSIFTKAVQAGYKEIVLTGTHIGQYRGGAHCGLENLVEKLADIGGDFRIRLSSLDPRDLSDSLMEMVGLHPRLCMHMHLSVQSLSPAVLVKMGRPLAEHDSLVTRLASFRRRFPLAGLGGDFIVGFPQETEEQFEETCGAITRCGFTGGHVFRYSMRPGTPTASMPQQIDGKEKKRRSARLRELLDECRCLFVKSTAGAVQRIVVETKTPAAGLASNYLRVEVPGHTAPVNSWLNVMVTGTDGSGGRCVAVLAEE